MRTAVRNARERARQVSGRDGIRTRGLKVRNLPPYPLGHTPYQYVAWGREKRLSVLVGLGFEIGVGLHLGGGFVGTDLGFVLLVGTDLGFGFVLGPGLALAHRL